MSVNKTIKALREERDMLYAEIRRLQVANAGTVGVASISLWDIRSRPADQHQDEPVAYCFLRRNGYGEWVNDMKRWECGAAPKELTEQTYKHPDLYRIQLAFEHPDSGEIDQLRLEVEKLRLDLTMLDAADIQDDCVRSENTALRAQLAERDALLREGSELIRGIWDRSYDYKEGEGGAALDLADRIDALIAGAPACDHQFTDDGQHLLVCTECGYQEDHDPKWRPIETAPTDGTIVRLLVEFEENSTEDDQQAPTIGHNSFKDTGEDEWQFAGWNWQQDCYTSGQGTPVGWLPLLDPPVTNSKT